MKNIKYLSDLTKEMYLLSRYELEEVVRDLINATYDSDVSDEVITAYNNIKEEE